MMGSVTLRDGIISRQTRGGRYALTMAVAILLVMLSLPWWADAGVTRSVVEFSCYLGLATMWNLLAGYAGMVSIGQQAFLGVAAYAMFAFANHFGIDPFVAVGLCLLAPALLAVPTYALLRRLEGPYFAIGTWVVAEVCRLVISNTEWLGSSSGMTLRAMQKYSLEQRQMGVLWLAVLMLVVTVGGTYWLLRSRHGLALTAMRDNATAATSQGVDVERLRFLVFLGAAIGTGLVGAPACGDVMRLQIKVNDEGVIEDAKFKTFGCGSAIASSSLATEWLRGKTVAEAEAIKNVDIVNELNLPPVKIHCSVLAEDAIKGAIEDYRAKQAARRGATAAAVAASPSADAE